MTFKSGDTIAVELRLASIYGASQAPVYASLAAFLAAGWTLPAYRNAVLVSPQPTYNSLTPDPAGDGAHHLSTVLQQGVTIVRAVPPASRKDLYATADLTLVVPLADTDSIQATLNSTTGSVITGGITTNVSDVSLVEGDSYQGSFTVPTSALKVFDLAGKLIYQYTDLSDIGGQPWTIAAQGRYLTEGGQLPGVPVAFSFQAAVTDKTGRIVAIGWLASPAGAIVDDILPSAPTVTVSGGAITGATGGTGGHIYGSNAVTIALTGGGGTGGVLTATIVNGQITGYTVTTPGTGYATPPTATLSVASDGNVLSRTFAIDIQLVPPSGSTYATAKLTVVSGRMVIYRQQTTTP